MYFNKSLVGLLSWDWTVFSEQWKMLVLLNRVIVWEGEVLTYIAV